MFSELSPTQHRSQWKDKDLGLLKLKSSGLPPLPNPSQYSHPPAIQFYLFCLFSLWEREQPLTKQPYKP